MMPPTIRPPRVIVVTRPAVDVRATSGVALQRGGVIIPHQLYPELTGTDVEWDISARCERPLQVEQRGEGHHQQSANRQDLVWQSNRTLRMQVPCKHCATCLRRRRTLFGRRAVSEFTSAPRTWFGTLTFSPENRFRNLALTRQRLDAGGTDLATLVPVDRYREQHRETGPLVSKYIRALRKGRKKLGLDPLFFRYLLTVEPHKDWTPHYHLLVHETYEWHPVRKKALEAQWKHGFVNWRLVSDPNAAFYAAKYLGKFSMARVRASKNYGVKDQSIDLMTRTTF